MADEAGFPTELWNAAYVAAGPSRDRMWEWLEARYLACAAERDSLRNQRDQLQARVGMSADWRFWEARAEAAEARVEALSEALRQWKCRSCDAGVAHCICDKQVCTCNLSGKRCRWCEGTGLSPVARAALAAALHNPQETK